jgi:hypothetical protein
MDAFRQRAWAIHEDSPEMVIGTLVSFVR